MARADAIAFPQCDDEAERMRLRDRFAAAALTGLLNDPSERGLDVTVWACMAYELADAMLREREMPYNKNHDAAPAAIASVPTVDRAAGRSCSGGLPRCDAGTGDTQEAVAWMVIAEDIGKTARACGTLEEADRLARKSVDYRRQIVPLYRSPTLMPKEREALDAAQNHIDGYDGEWGDSIAATIRGLLRRMGGER